jgi:uncharacterized membrane protein YfcA
MLLSHTTLLRRKQEDLPPTSILPTTAAGNPLAASASASTSIDDVSAPAPADPPTLSRTTSVVVLEGDVVWKNWGARMPIGAVVVGAVSALLGIDSGELIMPMFLGMGLLPQARPLFICTPVLFSTANPIRR